MIALQGEALYAILSNFTWVGLFGWLLNFTQTLYQKTLSPLLVMTGQKMEKLQFRQTLFQFWTLKGHNFFFIF